MDIVDLLKVLGGLGGVFGLIVAGLFGLSKFRNSKLHSTFEKITKGIESDKEKIHQIDVSIGKSEQKKEDIQVQIDKVDQELAKVESTPSKPSTNDAVIDMFDKLSKK